MANPLAVLDPVVYHGRPIVVYRVGRLHWNARINDPWWDFPYGDTFDAMTQGRALAKAKRWVDWRVREETIERQAGSGGETLRGAPRSGGLRPESLAARTTSDAAGSLTALLDAIDRGRALLPNGALLLEVDVGLSDGVLWRSDASMLLDQDDLASLRALAAGLAVPAATAATAARLNELMDEQRGWAESPATREGTTFEWMLEATREINRLHDEVASLSRTLASRTEHLV